MRLTVLPPRLAPRVCAIGGRDDRGNVLASIECLELGEPAWSTVLGGLRTARFGHAAALTSSGSEGQGDQIHVYGGTDAQGRALNTVEVRVRLVHVIGLRRPTTPSPDWLTGAECYYGGVHQIYAGSHGSAAGPCGGRRGAGWRRWEPDPAGGGGRGRRRGIRGSDADRLGSSRVVWARLQLGEPLSERRR
jgi:hypothetical protein